MIGLGIPAAVIGAVENGGEPVRVLAQDDVEFAAAFGRQHFTPIPLAHGRDFIGENDPTLEEVEPAKILDASRLEIPLRQIRQIEIKAPETSLFREMMNREHGGERQSLVDDQHGHERGRPIVDMKDLRHGRHPPRYFERGFGEENETGRVVIVGHAVLAVDAGAIEEFVAANKEHLHAAGGPAFHKFRDMILRADPDVHRDSRVPQIDCVIFADLAIERHHDPDLVLARAHFAGQRLQHIHERGGAGERRSFRADHQDTHAKKSNRGLRGLHGWERSDATSGFIRAIRVIRG